MNSPGCATARWDGLVQAAATLPVRSPPCVIQAPHFLRLTTTNAGGSHTISFPSSAVVYDSQWEPMAFQYRAANLRLPKRVYSPLCASPKLHAGPSVPLRPDTRPAALALQSESLPTFNQFALRIGVPSWFCFPVACLSQKAIGSLELSAASPCMDTGEDDPHVRAHRPFCPLHPQKRCVCSVRESLLVIPPALSVR